MLEDMLKQKRQKRAQKAAKSAGLARFASFCLFCLKLLARPRVSLDKSALSSDYKDTFAVTTKVLLQAVY
jgi:hypothetical protein